jgi:alpha-tubulin suppressor-like RCC1 family protein
MGELGDGTSPYKSAVPVAVSAGGLTFVAISAGEGFTCALTGSGAAYCWGSNVYGQLGVGSASGPEYCSGYACSRVPVPVSGGLTFNDLSAGASHTCGVTTSGAAYCWGDDQYGQLGIGSTSSSAAPVAVSAAGLTFASVSASGVYSCGLTSTGGAYCWGYNGGGQLGNGSTSPSSVPVAVSGGLTFTEVGTGAGHTCGRDATGAAYCWGGNDYGQLGSGSQNPNSLVPVAVNGGLVFSGVDVGDSHTCGVAAGGIAYCWGDNFAGQLGNGTTTQSNVPVKVLGQP